MLLKIKYLVIIDINFPYIYNLGRYYILSWLSKSMSFIFVFSMTEYTYGLQVTMNFFLKVLIWTVDITKYITLRNFL